MALETVAYVSTVRRGLAIRELKGILRHGRARNFRLGMCSYLVYDGDHFAQVLEGPPAPLETLLASIARDPRHHSMRVVCRESVAEAAFADAALRCVSLEAAAGADASELRGLVRAFAGAERQPLPTVRAFFELFGERSRYDLAGLLM